MRPAGRCLVGLALLLAGAPLPSPSLAWAQEKAQPDPEHARHSFEQGRQLLQSRLPTDAHQALEPLGAALRAYEALDDRAGAAEALYALAVAHHLADDAGAARLMARRAVGAYRTLDDPAGQAAALDHLGSLLAAQGQFAEAEVFLLRALDVRERQVGEGGSRAPSDRDPGAGDDPETGPRIALASTLHNLGSVALETGQARAALERFRRARQLRARVGDRRGEAATNNNLGLLFLHLGRFDEARGALEAALALHRRLDDRRGQAGTTNNLGFVAWREGRLDQAERHFAAALALYRSFRDAAGIAESLGNLGLVDLARGRLAPARLRIEAALHHARQLGVARIEASHLASLGRLLVAEGELDAAVHTLADAAARLHQLGAVDSRRIALADLAEAHTRAGAPEAAARALDLALEELESLGSPLGPGDPRAELLAPWRPLYDARIDLHVRAGETRRALALSERCRARGLLDLLRLARDPNFAAAAPAPPDTAPTDTAQADTAQNDTAQNDTAPTETAPTETAPTSDQALARFGELLATSDRVLVYHLGHERAWAWLLEADPAFVSAGVAVGLRLVAAELGSSREIEERARHLHQALADSRGRARQGLATVAARRLAELLLDPFAAALGPAEEPTGRAAAPGSGLAPSRADRRLLIVPDGALHGVPFAVLPWPPARGEDARASGLLLDRYRLSYLPSLAALGPLRARADRGPRRELAVFADPVFAADDPRLPRADSSSASAGSDPESLHSGAGRGATSAGPRSAGQSPPEPTWPRLPWSAVEAETIAAHFPAGQTRVATGFDVARGPLLGADQGLVGFRRLHFATHARIDDRHPERSGLAVSAFDARGRPVDGFLRLEDLFRLRLDADLVTLGACRSALGKPLRGEGFLGLGRGFFAAGARGLLVSLWEVDDRASAVFMTELYRRLARGDSPDAALARAQRHLRDEPRWRSPFYWAGFVLIGDGA